MRHSFNAGIPPLNTLYEYLPQYRQLRSQAYGVKQLLYPGDGPTDTEITFDKYCEELEDQAREHSILSNRSLFGQFKKDIRSVYYRDRVLFSIDVEAFERDSSCVTEIGISIFDPLPQKFANVPRFLDIHIIISEHYYMRNKSYLPDHKENFLFGDSLVMTSRDAKMLIQVLINFYFKQLPQETGQVSALVGHDVRGDIRWLRDIGIKIPVNPYIIDTQKMFAYTHGTQGNSLVKLLHYFKIPHSHLHNAGNDAHYTLLLLMHLCDPHVRLLWSLDCPYHAVSNYREAVENMQLPSKNQRSSFEQMKEPTQDCDFMTALEQIYVIDPFLASSHDAYSYYDSSDY